MSLGERSYSVLCLPRGSTLSGSAVPDTPILFFDGTCGLCNRTVNLLLRLDRRRKLRYATLQGNTARQMLGDRDPLPDAIVLLDERGQHTHSTAVLRAISTLGGLWKVAAVLQIVPRPWRDRIYSAIARRRYAWFGKRDSCRLPQADERTWFLP
jgi:predicted DCC family thiol-disulfide oxidoreductase YuxK